MIDNNEILFPHDKVRKIQDTMILDVKEAIEKADNPIVITTPANTPSPVLTYNPNITASDFAFKPNWYLIGAGVVLLGIAYILRK